MFFVPTSSSAILGALVFALTSRAPAVDLDAHSLALKEPSGEVRDLGTSQRIAFEGVVRDSSGAPAEGVVVVSSAGGRAITGPTGAYRLEVSAPIGAESLQITAVGGAGGQQTATATAPMVAAAGAVQVGPLQLAQAGACSPNWLPTFGPKPGVGGLSGFPVTVKALAVFDDGAGPALYAGGEFSTAGGTSVSHIAKWDGSSWTALGAGVNGDVGAMTVFDDGAGPALYVGGEFVNAGGAGANRIAKWDGSTWSALGSGLNNFVDALAVFDDGSGPALYTGGGFTIAGGVSAQGIAKWNGSSWSALGSGISLGFQSGTASALLVANLAGAPTLCVGGTFDKAGGLAAANVATWNGSLWGTLGTGMNGAVTVLQLFDDGGGPALHAGGGFTTAGGVAASRVAKWNGASWAALGSGVDNWVLDLTVFDDGAGSALYAGGSFSNAGGATATRIAKWSGSSWTPLATGLLNSGTGSLLCHSLAVFDDGTGPALYAGGAFTVAGATLPALEAMNHIAKWTGSSWESLGSGLNRSVGSLVVFDDGSGPAVYAGGIWDPSNSLPLGGAGQNNIAKWTGSSWAPLSSAPVGWVAREVATFAVFDDGSGAALYAAGEFGLGGPGSSDAVARWNGSSFALLGGQMNQSVDALAVIDAGGGPRLYAGGTFTSAGGASANRIAMWSGSSWTPLGVGMSPFAGSSCTVHALAVFDDGSGPALYAGGFFESAGGVVVNNVAKWDGANWTALGSGVDELGPARGSVSVLGVFDDGTGPALYAGGRFDLAGGVAASNIAKWDGSTWTPLGGGLSGASAGLVRALAVHDDGSGPALFVGGGFATAGGLAASNIAKWNGSSWAPLGSGVSAWARAMTVFDDGVGLPALYVGGDFLSAFDSGDSYVAAWRCPLTASGTAYCTAGVTTNGCVPAIAGSGSASSSAGAGFTISISSVEGQKAGLIFYGVQGAKAAPWGTGSSYLCVEAPVSRMASQSSGGTAGACNGVFSQDWNAFIAAHPGALGQPFGAGSTVWAQAWFRDPPAPKSTNLSNALVFQLLH